MTRLKWPGLVLFLIGFTGWIFVLTLGQFRLTDSVISNTVKAEQQAVVRQQTGFMTDKLYENNWSFISDFRGALGQYNDRMKAEKAWDKVIYDDYTFEITRASSLGVLTGSGSWLWFWLTFGLCALGGLVYAYGGLKRLPGIDNNRQFQSAGCCRSTTGSSRVRLPIGAGLESFWAYF